MFPVQQWFVQCAASCRLPNSPITRRPLTAALAGLFLAVALAPAAAQTADPTAVPRTRNQSRSRSSAKRPATERKVPSVSEELPTTAPLAAANVTDLPPALVADPLTTSPVAGALELPPVPELSYSELSTGSALLHRLDDALADVAWNTGVADLDGPPLVEDTTATDWLEAQNLLPDSPLPVEELDRLTSTSPGAARLSLMEALCRSLEGNQALQVERLRPEISNTSIESALSAFDTTLRTNIGAESARSSTLGARARGFSDDREEETRIARGQDADVSLSGRLPTGTNYGISYDTARGVSDRSYPFYSSALNLNITQNLLKGAGCEVNLVQVRTAQNGFVRSLYSLQQYLNNLTVDVQSAYFDLYLAVETLRIRRQAYAVARERREQVRAFVEVGRAAPLEAFAAQAEEATRISGVISSAADLRRQQLDLLRLINPVGMPEGWETRLFPSEPPIIPREALVPEAHVKLAQRYRPDLRQAEIDLANGDLEVLRTENGLLPALDFVARAGVTGSGDTLGSSNERAADADFRNYRVGLQFEYPLQNRAAKASWRRSVFDKKSAQESILNLMQLIQVEVRAALIDIDRTRRLIESTTVTRRLRELEYQAELEKFRVGRSTQVLVNQVFRDLTSSQLDEVTARVAHMRAYLELYRADGTVLLRRGIEPIYILPTSGVPSP